MARSKWCSLVGVDRLRLRDARLQAHYAAQWLARAARAYVPARTDDSHTNLGWDTRLNGFTTHSLQNGVCLGLKIVGLELVLLGKRTRSVRALTLGGNSDAVARRWLGGQCAAFGLDADRLDAPAPYDIFGHAIASGARYDTAGLGDSFADLTGWFANANLALEDIRAEMIARNLAASAVRCWPHHFDMATLIALDEGGGVQGRSVNVGLSPGDEWYDEPYFYVSPYPYPDAAALPALPRGGHWHTRGFTAAIATASRIRELPDPQTQTETFLRGAIRGATVALGINRFTAGE